MSPIVAYGTIISTLVTVSWLDGRRARRRIHRVSPTSQNRAKVSSSGHRGIAGDPDHWGPPPRPAPAKEAGGPSADAANVAQLTADNAKLAADIERLKRERVTIDAEHKAAVARLRSEAEAAENLAKHWHQSYRRLAETKAAPGAPSADPKTERDEGRRFRVLRALIIKELHPDGAPQGSLEATIRSELFKALWPKIEMIENS